MYLFKLNIQRKMFEIQRLIFENQKLYKIYPFNFKQISTI